MAGKKRGKQGWPKARSLRLERDDTRPYRCKDYVEDEPATAVPVLTH